VVSVFSKAATNTRVILFFITAKEARGNTIASTVIFTKYSLPEGDATREINTLHNNVERHIANGTNRISIVFIFRWQAKLTV
jgi:hypothetical protein